MRTFSFPLTLLALWLAAMLVPQHSLLVQAKDEEESDSSSSASSSHHHHHHHSSSSSSRPSGIKLTTYGSGQQELPPVTTDTSAKLYLTFERDFSSMDYKLMVQNGVQIRAAHLHCGAAGVNGGIVVDLFTGPTQAVVDGALVQDTLVAASLTRATKCVNDAVAITNIAALYDAIRQGKIYFNVHSDANPSGVVRGQVYVS